MPLTRDLQFDIKPVPPSRTLTKVTHFHWSDVEFGDVLEERGKTSEILQLGMGEMTFSSFSLLFLFFFIGLTFLADRKQFFCCHNFITQM